MAVRSFKVKFLDRAEIRMGSPYRTCRVRLTGVWVPDLPGNGEGFQDLKAWSADGNHLALVQWRVLTDNEPGFRIITFDVQGRQLKQSRRIRGCCSKIWWNGAEFQYQSYVVNVGSIRVK